MFISSEIEGRDIDMEMAGRFASGDPEAFSYFFNKLYPALLYYAFRILNDKPTADDAVSTAFERIWINRGGFEHPKVIKSWLYTTTKNACLNTLQGYLREDKRNDGMRKLMEDDHEASTEEKIIMKEQLKELYAYVDVLPTACKEVFYLLYKEGRTVRQTAEELGLSISTIKNQKARGIGLINKWRVTGTKRAKAEIENKAGEGPKTFLDMLNEGNDDAWDTFFENTHKQFYYLFNDRYSEGFMERKVNNAFQMVKSERTKKDSVDSYLKHIERVLESVVRNIVIQPFKAVKPIPRIRRVS